MLSRYQDRSHVSPFIRQLSDDLLDVKVVLDIGSRWGKDALNLKMLFPEAKVYAFECTPHSINIWKQNVKDLDIILVEKAVCDYTGETIFYTNDPVLTRTNHELFPDGNQGANSLFKGRLDYEPETYVQIENIVPCTTLQDWMLEACIEKVDLIHIDVQGAELKVFQGMGEALKEVRAIHTEVNFPPGAYEGMALYEDVDEYLKSMGFAFVSFEDGNKWFANANYLRMGE